MAAPTARRRPVRTLVSLGVLTVVLIGALLAGTHWSKATLSPLLALDLEGGTQLILTPVPEAAGQVTATTISQAIDVIRQRVDASGVAEAEITSQGAGANAKIVVSLPGNPSQETLDLVRTSAQMEFRPVLVATTSVGPATSDSATPTPTPSESAGTEGAGPSSPSDSDYYVTDAVQQEFDKLDCSDPANRKGGVNGAADAAFVTCDQNGLWKYILGPVEVQGQRITGASSGLEQLSTGGVGTDWVVSLSFDSQGATQFAATTQRLLDLASPKNQFGIVLDGLVISAPVVNTVIPDGNAQITGNFTRASAASLANQLSFGSLPVSFQVESEQQISATLGSEQLERGLIAGLIGLVLVFIYSLFQYRTLGLLTIGSLVVAGLLTYVSIALLSWGMGYRLSLAGIAGLIVAIGFTADSFIVYFERIRDELRDGRTLAGAVERGWTRARRTILAAKGVNLVSAVVLYYLAVGGVQGFAFTLGLTTIIDVAVVFWFTHPVMEVLSKVPFFRDGHRASGLSPDRLRASGIRYVGAGRFAGPESPTDVAAEVNAEIDEEAPPPPVPVGARPIGAHPAPQLDAQGHRMTIAERRAAARSAANAEGDAPASGTNEENL